MIKLLKTCFVTILLALLLSGCTCTSSCDCNCTGNDDSSDYNWERLRAISKIANNHNSKWLIVDPKYVDSQRNQVNNPWAGKKFKIEPTINELGTPDVNISIINDLDLKFPRLKDRSSDITTTRHNTLLGYSYSFEGCNHRINMKISRPKRDEDSVVRKILIYDIEHLGGSNSTCDKHEEEHNAALERLTSAHQHSKNEGILNHLSDKGTGRD